MCSSDLIFLDNWTEFRDDIMTRSTGHQVPEHVRRRIDTLIGSIESLLDVLRVLPPESQTIIMSKIQGYSNLLRDEYLQLTGHPVAW